MNNVNIIKLIGKGYFQLKGKAFPDIVRKSLLMVQTRPLVKKIIDTIDVSQLNSIREKYTHRTEVSGPLKYFDVEKWVWDRLCDTFRLKLHKRNPCVMLDIGTGFGYFPYICEFLGHKAYAIDLDEDPMFNDVIKFLGVKRTVQRVERFKPLTKMEQRFDIITAYMVCFNGLWEKFIWGAEEWNFFLKDCARNYCKETSEMLFLLNPQEDGRFYSDELYRYFIRIGARVRNNEIYIPCIKKLLTDATQAPEENQVLVEQ